VFQAATNPEQLARWWGPKGFRNTFHEFDCRPGGAWRFVMHGPGGANYPNESVFVEVIPQERIVFRHVSSPQFLMTATYAEEAGKTRLTWRMDFDSVEVCEKVKVYAVEANEQNFDRLAELLAKLEGGVEPFIISRLLDAPRELVFQAWTEREHLRWWGPKGVEILHQQIDLRPGGVFLYCMRTPEGQEIWGKWVLREIVKPEKLVFMNSFSDNSGGLTRHPGSQAWPLEILSTVTFSSHEGKTLLTVSWVPVNATVEELKTFNENHASMQQGWSGTLDRLVGHLSKAA
jgi:uncharacterized protein YndB with AHSA1/START domain